MTSVTSIIISITVLSSVTLFCALSFKAVFQRPSKRKRKRERTIMNYCCSARLVARSAYLYNFLVRQPSLEERERERERERKRERAERERNSRESRERARERPDREQ